MPLLQFPLSPETAANLQRFNLHTIVDYARTTPYRAAALLTVAATNSILYNTGALDRNKLPEPWDFPDHAGNVTWSLVAGAATGQIVARTVERVSPRASPRIVRAAITVGALAVGTAINWLVESRAGQQLIGNEVMQLAFSGRDARDGVDLAYGALAATAASTVVTTNSTHPPLSPRTN